MTQPPIPYAKRAILASLETDGVAILPPLDVQVTLRFLRSIGITAKVIMLDPWYNKGVGGVREDYKEYIVSLIKDSSEISENVFVWGFPEIIACFVERIPKPLILVQLGVNETAV